MRTWKNCFKAENRKMQAALSLRSDVRFLPHSVSLCFSLTPISPFFPPSSLLFSPDMFLPLSPTFSSHLPPSLKSLLAACHTLITIYFPLRAITLRGLIFFPLSYSWTFETRRIVWSPCLEALTWVVWLSVANGRFGNGTRQMYRPEKALLYFELPFFLKV